MLTTYYFISATRSWMQLLPQDIKHPGFLNRILVRLAIDLFKLANLKLQLQLTEPL